MSYFSHRYEEWENRLLEPAVRHCELPMWNAIFCAISPEYTNMGICSMLYERAITIMADYWLNNTTTTTSGAATKESCRMIRCKSFSVLNNNNNNRQSKNKSRCLSETSSTEHLPCKHQHHRNLTAQKHAVAAKLNSDKSAVAPLVLAVSHSERAASFHKSNGFSAIKLIEFHDEVTNVTPFYVHILAHEPLRGGNLLRFDSSVQKSVSGLDTRGDGVPAATAPVSRVLA